MLINAYSSIRRVTDNAGETHGTAFRLTERGLFCTCTHVVGQDGAIQELYIDGELRTFAGSDPFHDLAFVHGRALQKLPSFLVYHC